MHYDYDNLCIQCCCVLWASTHVKCGSRWRKIYRRCEGRSILHTWCVIWTMTVKNILAKYVHILIFFKEFLCLRKLLHLCLNETYLGIIDTLSHFFIILNFPYYLPLCLCAQHHVPRRNRGYTGIHSKVSDFLWSVANHVPFKWFLYLAIWINIVSACTDYSLCWYWNHWLYFLYLTRNRRICREIVGINPESTRKQGQGKPRTKKRASIHPRVMSLMNKIRDFESDWAVTIN